MNTIGIIAPKNSRKKTNFLNHFKPDFIFCEKNLLRLVVTYDNQNYNKIFKKHNIEYAVCAENTILKHKANVSICNGESFFEKHLIYFIIKNFKLYGLNSETASLSIVFDCYTKEIETLIIQSSKLFRYIVLVTNDNIENVASMLMNEYGIDAATVSKEKNINIDMSVEIGKHYINYLKNTIVINIYSNILLPQDYNISMPKNIGFNINKIALAEAFQHCIK